MAAPVYYSAVDYRHFYWVSSPQARHSRNLSARAEISIVIFNSWVAIGGGQAVYIAAVAEQVSDAELEPALEIYSAGALARGGRAWRPADVREPAPYRLYRATATGYWVRDPDKSPDQRRAIGL